jgi:hypothetical protein
LDHSSKRSAAVLHDDAAGSPCADAPPAKSEAAAFLQWLSSRLASFRPSGAEPARPKPETRRAVVEWVDGAGETVSQRALLQPGKDGILLALVRSRLTGSTARILEQGSSYLVQIKSISQVAHGFELRCEYIRNNGRRREERSKVHGTAVLEGDGHAAVRVEVVNVSTGGMQVMSPRAMTAGAGVRVSGTETDYVGVVRYCREAPSGYRLGIQLFGVNRR